MIIADDHMTRTFEMLDFRTREERTVELMPHYEPRHATADMFDLSGDCFPTGRPADMERATIKQLHYIRQLAGLEWDGPHSDGWDFVVAAQGQRMSKTQAGHIIGKLLEERH